jgi:hypothetical protein
MFALVFKSGGVYDTGLVGSITINPTLGTIVLRGLYASPSDFTGTGLDGIMIFLFVI